MPGAPLIGTKALSSASFSLRRAPVTLRSTPELGCEDQDAGTFNSLLTCGGTTRSTIRYSALAFRHDAFMRPPAAVAGTKVENRFLVFQAPECPSPLSPAFGERWEQICAVPGGLNFIIYAYPRLKPWAIIFRARGARVNASSNSSIKSRINESGGTEPN